MKSVGPGLLLGFSLLAVGQSGAQPIPDPDPYEFVRVCDVFGASWYYIPGTETCIHPETGRTRHQPTGTPGNTPLANRITALEQRMGGASLADVAIANALEDPDLTGDENFGVRMNWGAARGANAFGFTGTAVIARDFLPSGGRIAASGGVAFSGRSVGGRAGLQVTW